MDLPASASGLGRRRARVTQALSGYVKVKVQAEQPDEAPTSDLMKRFRAVGLPAYVILQPTPPSTAGR